MSESTNKVKIQTMKKAKKEEKQDFSAVVDAIKGLREEFTRKIKELDDKIERKENKDTITVDLKDLKGQNTSLPEKPKAPEKPKDIEYPVPKEYINLLNTIFNDRFGIKVIPDPERPQFTLHILVPREYSNAGEQIWKDAKADLRAKVLTYGDGLLGVKTFMELVKANLGSDINARIQKDKE